MGIETLETIRKRENFVEVSAINLKVLEVNFNKATTKSTAEVDANYLLNGTAVTGNVDSVKLSEDGKKVTITFANSSLLTNKTYYNFEVKDVKDADGNKVEYAGLLHVKDTVAPAVKETKLLLAADQYIIKLSEPLKASSNGKVKVYDKDGADITASIVTPSTITDELIVNTSGFNAKETYKVVIQGAEDLAGNLFANNRVELTFVYDKDDNVKPTVVSMEAKDQKTIRVTFSEPIYVDTSASDKIAEMTVAGGASANVVVGALGTVGNAAKVKDNPAVWDITVSTANLTGPVKITLVKFVDLASNEQTTAYEQWITFVEDKTAPVLVSSKVEGSKLYLTFDEDITFAGSGNITVLYNNIENIYATGATAGASDIGVVVDATDNKIVELDLVNAVKAAGNYEISIAKGILADAATNSAVYTVTKGFTLVDTEKPEIVSGLAGIVQTPNKPSEFKITFSKDLDAATALNVNNYKVNGKVVFTKAVFEGTEKVVRLEAKAGEFDIIGDYQFAISNVKSKAGVAMDAFTGLKTSVNENVAPTFTAKLDAGLAKIVLTFNESIKGATGVDEADFIVKVDGVAVDQKTAPVKLATDVAGTTVTLELTSAITDVTKTITVEASSANDVVDAVGNKLVTDVVTVK